MEEANREREVIESPKAQALQDELIKALIAYAIFLEDKGLIWGDDSSPPRTKASALVVTYDYPLAGVTKIMLKNGAIDRVYGNGVNPDPWSASPPDIPHKERPD